MAVVLVVGGVFFFPKKANYWLVSVIGGQRIGGLRASPFD
jgi:hypothetical protein